MASGEADARPASLGPNSLLCAWTRARRACRGGGSATGKRGNFGPRHAPAALRGVLRRRRRGTALYTILLQIGGQELLLIPRRCARGALRLGLELARELLSVVGQKLVLGVQNDFRVRPPMLREPIPQHPRLPDVHERPSVDMVVLDDDRTTCDEVVRPLHRVARDMVDVELATRALGCLGAISCVKQQQPKCVVTGAATTVNNLITFPTQATIPWAGPHRRGPSGDPGGDPGTPTERPRPQRIKTAILGFYCSETDYGSLSILQRARNCNCSAISTQRHQSDPPKNTI